MLVVDGFHHLTALQYCSIERGQNGGARVLQARPGYRLRTERQVRLMASQAAARPAAPSTGLDPGQSTRIPIAMYYLVHQSDAGIACNHAASGVKRPGLTQAPTQITMLARSSTTLQNTHSSGSHNSFRCGRPRQIVVHALDDDIRLKYAVSRSYERGFEMYRHSDAPHDWRCTRSQLRRNSPADALHLHYLRPPPLQPPPPSATHRDPSGCSHPHPHPRPLATSSAPAATPRHHPRRQRQQHPRPARPPAPPSPRARWASITAPSGPASLRRSSGAPPRCASSATTPTAPHLRGAWLMRRWGSGPGGSWWGYPCGRGSARGTLWWTPRT